MQVRFISSIEDVPRQQWNAVAGLDYPFTRHEFLHALEVSGATTRQSGWQPRHLLVFDQTGERLLALMPLYLKYHSYGEYVFDWSWANAYQRTGQDYYPKLLAAIPFTPATGPRLCAVPEVDRSALIERVVGAVRNAAVEQELSSVHILFPDPTLSEQLNDCGLLRRRGVQFHWFNHNYQCFDDFLAGFSSRKRKNLNKERRRVAAQGLHLETLCGTDIPATIWRQFYDFYQLTYAKRSGHGGYLSQSFFERIADTLAEHLVMVLAYDQASSAQPIAGALNFRDSSTLYGRYWGCTREYDFLHFEACYYQGIEYCIREGLVRFDPGAQGEHKIQRGFTPIETWSNHWLAHAGFQRAVEDFLARENEAMTDYLLEARQLLPFRAPD